MPIQAYLIVCPLVMLAGFVDSIAGGGGLISLPAYYLAGLSPEIAAGTNKLSASLGTTASVIRYQAGGKVRLSAALPAALTAVPGSILGARLLMHINPEYIRWMVIAAIPVVAAVVLFRKDGLTAVRRVPAGTLPFYCALIGLVIGFYDGLIGPGTGTFLILIMTMALGMDAVDASGSAKVVNLASNLSSLIVFMIGGKVIVPLGLTAAAFGIAGNILGASLTLRRGARFIRLILLAVLTLLLVKMVIDMLT